MLKSLYGLSILNELIVHFSFITACMAVAFCHASNHSQNLKQSADQIRRTYYGRGGHTSMLPQNHSTDNIQEQRFSMGPDNTDYSAGAYTTDPSASETSLGDEVHQPRTRPHDHVGHSRNDSLPITRIRPSEINLVEVRGPPRSKFSNTWSPHLWQHRSSVPKRRSLFMAPAIDIEAVSRSPKRRTIQVVLFTVGFIFPLGVLPLSPNGTCVWH